MDDLKMGVPIARSEVESVTGTVAGETAMLGSNVHFNWRTLADERYFLDTGGLDNIEVEGR
jgi:hypothetical protein